MNMYLKLIKKITKYKKDRKEWVKVFIKLKTNSMIIHFYVWLI